MMLKGNGKTLEKVRWMCPQDLQWQTLQSEKSFWMLHGQRERERDVSDTQVLRLTLMGSLISGEGLPFQSSSEQRVGGGWW